MDGYEATATIRKQELNGNTPIIALTASILPEELQNCLKVGFSDTLNKPINRDEMNYVILKWLIKE
jgi:CheY-like chemotaxis protein